MKETIKQVKLSGKTDIQIREIAAKRLDEDHLVRTKQGIVAEAIQALYKKEISAKRFKHLEAGK